LHHRGLSIWDRDDPRRQELIDCRCAPADKVAAWVKQLHNRGQVGQDGQSGHGKVSTAINYQELAANTMRGRNGAYLSTPDMQEPFFIAPVFHYSITPDPALRTLTPALFPESWL
jgi:hypothetical protein